MFGHASGNSPYTSSIVIFTMLGDSEREPIFLFLPDWEVAGLCLSRGQYYFIIIYYRVEPKRREAF